MLKDMSLFWDITKKFWKLLDEFQNIRFLQDCNMQKVIRQNGEHFGVVKMPLLIAREGLFPALSFSSTREDNSTVTPSPNSKGLNFGTAKDKLE